MYQVSSRQLSEQPTLVMSAKLATSGIPEFLGKAYGEVAKVAGQSGVGFAGPPFARYRSLDDEYSEFEIEAGFPIQTAVEGSGEVRSSTLPGGTAAVVVHVGPYDQMKPAYEAIMTWITEQGATPEGAAWEVYLSDPETQPDPTTWRTEIVQPYG